MTVPKVGRPREPLTPEQRGLMKLALAQYKDYRETQRRAKQIAQEMVDERRAIVASTVNQLLDGGVSLYRVSRGVANTADMDIIKRLLREGESNG